MPFRGKHSEETKLKMSLAKKGKIPKNLSLIHQISKKGRTTWNKGLCGVQKHTIETREKISKSNSGERCYWWKGGTKKEADIVRRSFRYREWRKQVFERDNYTCVACGVKGGDLNADHIKSFIDHPELRFDVSNGRTLCIPCHKKTPTYSRHGSRSRTKSSKQSTE